MKAWNTNRCKSPSQPEGKHPNPSKAGKPSVPWRAWQDTTGAEKIFPLPSINTQWEVLSSQETPKLQLLIYFWCLEIVIQPLWHHHALISSRTGASCSSQDRWHSTAEHWASISCHSFCEHTALMHALLKVAKNPILEMPFISRLALLLLYYTNWASNLQTLIYFHILWRVKTK